MSNQGVAAQGGANPFARPPSPGGALAEAEQHRAIQEVQAALVIAKKFPRDPFAAFNRIIEACKRPGLAEGAMYAYPRGNQTITGPSIRLAEAMAQNWGNISFGIRELSSRSGSSEVEAFAWDMEANTKQVKIFHVAHVRVTKRGKTNLTDPRDIYEVVANQGARRMRACILGIIPGDVVDAAVRQCEQTLTKGQGESIQDRTQKMVAAFANIGVTVEMLEKRLRHNLDAINITEVIDLGKIFQSIRDGMGKREDFFDFRTQHVQQDERAKNLGERFQEEAK